MCRTQFQSRRPPVVLGNVTRLPDPRGDPWGLTGADVELHQLHRRSPCPRAVRSEGADTARAKGDCGQSDTDSEVRQRRQEIQYEQDRGCNLLVLPVEGGHEIAFTNDTGEDDATSTCV